jgi:hypothetical protein
MGRLKDAMTGARNRPRPGEDRCAYIARVADDGFGSLGYASVVQRPLWELFREVSQLRLDVQELRAEVAQLKS